MSSNKQSRGGARVDDATVASVLELHRTPKDDGKRRTRRDIARELNLAPATVSRIVDEAHAETIEAATSEVRERVAGQADRNVERIERMAQLLASSAEDGVWPDEAKCQGQVRVMAARDAVEASSKLLTWVGLQKPTEDLDPERIVDRARRLYGLDMASDEDEGEEDADNDGGAATQALH